MECLEKDSSLCRYFPHPHHDISFLHCSYHCSCPIIWQVEVGDQKSSGTGPNKKLAKRAAAEAMLLLMGYSKVQKQPSKPAIKAPGAESTGDDKQRKVSNVLTVTSQASVFSLERMKPPPPPTGILNKCDFSVIVP